MEIVFGELGNEDVKGIVVGRRKLVCGLSEGVGLVEGDMLVFVLDDCIC